MQRPSSFSRENIGSIPGSFAKTGLKRSALEDSEQAPGTARALTLVPLGGWLGGGWRSVTTEVVVGRVGPRLDANCQRYQIYSGESGERSGAKT